MKGPVGKPAAGGKPSARGKPTASGKTSANEKPTGLTGKPTTASAGGRPVTGVVKVKPGPIGKPFDDGKPGQKKNDGVGKPGTASKTVATSSVTKPAAKPASVASGKPAVTAGKPGPQKAAAAVGSAKHTGFGASGLKKTIQNPGATTASKASVKITTTAKTVSTRATPGRATVSNVSPIKAPTPEKNTNSKYNLKITKTISNDPNESDR